MVASTETQDSMASRARDPIAVQAANMKAHQASAGAQWNPPEKAAAAHAEVVAAMDAEVHPPVSPENREVLPDHQQERPAAAPVKKQVPANAVLENKK
jgi:hypothetical protein